jgi:hypothetical protein
MVMIAVMMELRVSPAKLPKKTFRTRARTSDLNCPSAIARQLSLNASMTSVPVIGEHVGVLHYHVNAMGLGSSTHSSEASSK